MTTAERPVEEIGMDFVSELLELEDFNAILVVTDRLTKVLYYVAATTTSTVSDFAMASINEIWQLHRLQGHITSDGGTQFASKFSKELNCKLHINQRLTTAYVSQNNRLSE